MQAAIKTSASIFEPGRRIAGHTLHTLAAGADNTGAVDVPTSRANGKAVAWLEADACSYQPEVRLLNPLECGGDDFSKMIVQALSC